MTSDSGNVEKLLLTQDGQQFDLSQVSGVWYRRLNVGGRIPAHMDEQFRAASIQESRATIFGLITSFRAFHLDAIDGRYVFLEVNPVGEFFWLEIYAGLPISNAIAELLLNSQ